MTELDVKKTQIQPIPKPYTDQATANSKVELSAAALNNNIATYRSLIPAHVQLAAIVKGNAYGHGMIPIAQFLDSHLSVDFLYTASLSEALCLRAHAIKKPITVLSYHDASLTQAIASDIDIVVYDLETAHAISQAAQQISKQAHVHIKLDTGLSRLGIRVEPNAIEQTIALIKHIAQLPGIIVRALFSHFADAEAADNTFVQYQQELFDKIALPFNAIKHLSCTAALGTIPMENHSIARFGIGLYGLWPSEENKLALSAFGATILPVMSWKTRIIQIKKIPAGSTVGYDRTYVTARPIIAAVLPVGYADGLDRKLSNCGHVLIHGTVAPIIGRVSMNVTVVDITDVAHAQVNDEVTLLGNHPAVHADTIARHVGTINYEVVTRISPHISRVLIP